MISFHEFTNYMRESKCIKSLVNVLNQMSKSQNALIATLDNNGDHTITFISNKIILENGKVACINGTVVISSE